MSHEGLVAVALLGGGETFRRWGLMEGSGVRSLGVWP